MGIEKSLTVWMFVLSIFFFAGISKAKSIFEQTKISNIEISDPRITGVLEKRKALVGTVSAEKLIQLFPLPQDKNALVSLCYDPFHLDRAPDCFEAVAEGFFEGGFKEEGRFFCEKISERGDKPFLAAKCACSARKNFYEIDTCIAKARANETLRLKKLEEAKLLAQILSPLPMVQSARKPPFVNLKNEIDPAQKIEEVVAIPEVLGEPLEAKAPVLSGMSGDKTGTLILKAFIESLPNRKNKYSIFSNDSYAFMLFSEVGLPKSDNMVKGLSLLRPEQMDDHTVKLISESGPNSYLVKEGDTWFLDHLKGLLEQQNSLPKEDSGIPELQAFLAEKEKWVSLVSRGLMFCKRIESDYHPSDPECPSQLVTLVLPLYKASIAPADLEPLLQVATAVLKAEAFEPKTVMTSSAFRDFEKNPLPVKTAEQKIAFLKNMFEKIQTIQKENGSKVKVNDKNTGFFLVEKNGQWFFDKEAQDEAYSIGL